MEAFEIRIIEIILALMIFVSGIMYLMDTSNTTIKFSEGNKMHGLVGEYWVTYHKDVKKWAVEIRKSRKLISPYFDTEKEAYLELYKLMEKNRKDGIYAYAVIPNKKEISDIFQGFNN